MEDMQKIEGLTQLMLDATPICCKLWSKEHTLLACNDACVRMFKVADKQEFCARFFEFSPPFQPDGRPSGETIDAILTRAFEEGYLQFEWMHRKADGSPLPSEVTLVRVEYQGSYVVAGYIRDLTEHYELLSEQHQAAEELRVARDEAQSANQAKSLFLANISHEMRTPLNVIIGLTDLCLEEDLPDHLKDDIEKVNSAGNSLLSIVNDVLDISKIEAGKFKAVPVRYYTASLLNDIITFNVIRIEGKPIAFTVDIDPNMPSEMFGDELRLKQIFNNLLSNAFKYTHEGRVVLRVRCEKDDEAGLWMYVSVADTGIGIRPEDLKKLFSDYQQVDTKANRTIEGTGLGLSITKRLAQQMGGDIYAASTYGKGSVFQVRVRQETVGAKPLGKETVDNLCHFHYSENKRLVSAQLVRIDMSYARVLVVDDFQTNLDVATGMIHKYKITVDCATSGQEAIDRVMRGTPVYDAIFMDHMMPEMDGIEAVRRIRALDSDYARSVPIIALTANAVAGNEQMFIDNGFQAFLSKPIDIMKLDAVLKAWVRDKAKEAAAYHGLPGVGSEPQSDAREVAIPGIDAEKALALYGNDAKLFIDVLRSYAANTPRVLESLRAVDAASLPAYTVNVHGLKGASANIGAEGLRGRAASLEAAAKEGDLPAVLAGNTGLIDEATALIRAIDAWLDGQEGQREKGRMPAPDQALLEELERYCEAFDMGGVDKVMDKLEGTFYEHDDDLVKWLRERVDASDFQEAALRIKEYEEALN